MLTSRILIKRTRIHTPTPNRRYQRLVAALLLPLAAARVSRGLVNPDVLSGVPTFKLFGRT